MDPASRGSNPEIKLTIARTSSDGTTSKDTYNLKDLSVKSGWGHDYVIVAETGEKLTTVDTIVKLFHAYAEKLKKEEGTAKFDKKRSALNETKRLAGLKPEGLVKRAAFKIRRALQEIATGGIFGNLGIFGKLDSEVKISKTMDELRKATHN